MKTKSQNQNQKITSHYHDKRYKREEFIKEYLGGDGNIIDWFIVDRGHVGGTEKHCITDNGIIIIYNNETGRLITKLIARRGQIERLYKNRKIKPPQWLLEIADWHTDLGCNNK